MFAAFRTTILKPDLYSCLAQTKSLTEFFSHKRIRIMGFIEEPLQFSELLQSEIRT